MKIDYRKKMENYLGRPLLSTEIIHHKNGDSTDDRLTNLQIVTPQEHIQIHKKERNKSRNRWKQELKKMAIDPIEIKLDVNEALNVFFTDAQQYLVYKKLKKQNFLKQKENIFLEVLNQKLEQ